MGLIAYEVAVEVTRRCNMQCAHCLRGNPQPVDIEQRYLDSLFSKLERINMLVITGGEPSLVPNKINAIVRTAKKHGVGIGDFYLVTNAKKVPDDFIRAVMNLYMYCDENETSALAYSDDEYHDEWHTSKNAKNDNIKRLKMLSFIQRKPIYGLIAEGRAEYNSLADRAIHSNRICVDDDGYIDDMIYLNCKGNIICNCDASYRTQDEPEYIVCHVDDLSLETLETYNEAA